MTFQTFTGRQYLAIDIANNFGLDKLDWDQRLDWFENNRDQLSCLVQLADEPALFYAGISAWEEVCQGKPIGYMISLDATSSGLQILAALTGDRLAAQLCNVVDTGSREDAYTTIYQRMLLATGGNAKIDRAQCKEAVMTAFYSSTAVPKRVFGEGELLALFYQTMEASAPGAWELNETMLQLWNPEAYSHDWVLPDNFHAQIKVMDTVHETVHFDDQPFQVSYKVNQPVAEGRSLGANMVHAIDGMMVREITRRCDYDQAQVNRARSLLNGEDLALPAITPEQDQLFIDLINRYENTGYLSARILEVLHPDNLAQVDRTALTELLESLPDKPFRVVSVHDCFRCLPHYGNDLRKQYNLQLELIAKSELLSDMISQLVGRRVQINKLDPELWRDIAQTNYSLS